MSTTTLTDLIVKARRKAGIEESAFITSSQNAITDAFITDELNSGASFLHQQMADTSEDWFLVTSQITVSANAWSTDLPSDFYIMRTVDKMVGVDGYRPVEDFSNRADRANLRGFYGYRAADADVPRYRLGPISTAAPGGVIEFQPASVAAGTYLISYTPQYSNMTAGSDSITFPLNWHDYVVTYAAIQCLVKLQLPTDELRETLARLERMVLKGAAKRGQPRKMLSLRPRRFV